MEQRRKMLSAKEVSELLDISNSYAYKVINQLNKELEKAGYLTIHGKVDSLYLNKRYFPFLVDELKEYIGLLYEPKEDQRIFQISKSKINSNFHKLSDQAGLKRITIHGLRHSHVSLLISKKYDIFEVSKRIGHKSVKTTQDIYGHLFDDVQKSIANDLNMIRRGGV